MVRLTLEEENGFAMEAIYFGDGIAFEDERGGRRVMDIVYYPEINEYNGNKSLQAVVRKYKFH